MLESVLKICVLGAGSLGCAIGGVLTEAGNDVWLINRNADQVDAMTSRGLILTENGEDRAVQVKASTTAKDAGVVDLVLVLVKSFHTKEAMEASTSLLGPDTVVLSLQNGAGHEDILTEIVGRERILAGKTYAGGTQYRVGQVTVGTKGRDTIIGELDGSKSDRLQRIVDQFNAADLLTHTSSNIMGTIWDKLLVNVATGALSGVSSLTYGDLYDTPEVVDCALAAVAEGMAVAKASGIELSTKEPRETWDKAADGMPLDFKASILQSLEKGSISEVDYINGAVVSQGAKVGVPTPINQTLVACIKGIERRMLNPVHTKPSKTDSASSATGTSWAVPAATDFKTPEKTWDDAKDGDVCISPKYVVTEDRIKAYAELTGDYTPVHLDEAYAATTPFGTRVAHGLLGLAIADGLKTQSEYRFLPGMSLGWTWDFQLPIKINDTLHVRFTVTGARPSKSRPEWGIVILKSELINQHDEVVQKGEHRLMIPRRKETE